MRVILIGVAVFLIISLSKSSYIDDDDDDDDDDDEPGDLVPGVVTPAVDGDEGPFGRKKRAVELDYGAGYGDESDDSLLN
uniref:Sperm protein 6kDa n=1 Tax=Haliotis discus TaxID=36094 RepID=M9WF44_HALDI|nr:sperm protein 6kDa [Haliotis discus]